MKISPVVWTKGTFLSAQHLQTQDRYLESVLQFRLHALNFRPWGFQELAWNREALNEGMFALTKATGILPDGLPFAIPDSDFEPSPVLLPPLFEGDRDSTVIHLALPPYRAAGLNISTGASAGNTRYLADTLMVRDENTGLAERPVQIARKNFRLLSDVELREEHMALPVARIRKSPAGIFEADAAWIPPLLRISANETLLAMLRRLLELLAAKSNALSSGRRQRNQSLADFTSADIANFWLLYTVNLHLPVFRHLLDTGVCHPERLFHRMAEIAGALTTFSSRIQVRDLPLYDHTNLGACFHDLDEKLRILLDTVVPSNFVSLPLKMIRPFIYGTQLPEEKLFQGTRFFLAVKADTTEADVIQKSPYLLKVSAAAHLEGLIRQALMGVEIRHIPQPPAPLPVKLDHQYFALNQMGPIWDSIPLARDLSVYVPADLPNPQLELLIVLPRAV